MGLQGSFQVAQDSALVLHACKSDEMLVRGLQKLVLPIGFTMSTVTVSEMGRKIDLKFPTGGEYDEATIDYNFLIGDPSQSYLQNAALNATPITDMRFEVVRCGDFAALDLISDEDGSYRIGSITSPSAAKNEVYSGSVTILPAGSSCLFDAHVRGTTLSTVAASGGVGPQVVDSANGFIDAGFRVGDTIILDYVDGMDPIYAKLESVSAGTLQLADGVGGADTIPTFSGTAQTAVHGAVPVEESAGGTVICAP